MVTDDNVNRHNKNAVISAFEAQNVDFIVNDFDIGYRMSEAAATAVKTFSSDWNPAFESMPVGQDQVGSIILSISNTLDPQSFYDALETQTAVLSLRCRLVPQVLLNQKKLMTYGQMKSPGT